MGMFDTVRIEVALPGGYEGKDFQTKDLSCEMNTFVLRRNGLFLQLPEKDEKGQPLLFNTHFDGRLQFYDYCGAGLFKYEAIFLDGYLMGICRVTENSYSLPSPADEEINNAGD